jgi:LacI family transcriptional regulator, repressor for deo operon, udp, cdd, tsx, nupC, and nupG
MKMPAGLGGSHRRVAVPPPPGEPPRRVSRIDDVARLAGVSTATVSRALRGLPAVAEQTRARVTEAAARLGYVASPHASRLAGGRTGAVGVVVPRITRWFFATVVEAAEETLYQAGWDVLLYNLGGHEQTRNRLLRTQALHKRVDAVMLVATPLHADDFADLVDLRLPGVTVSAGTPVPGWPSIRIDDVATARSATEHLIGLGHTRIAHITGDPDDELAFSTPHDRKTGYRAAHEAVGLGVDPELMFETGFTVRGGELAAELLLSRGDLPTAIFAGCDEIGMGAMRALRRAGVRVPDDVSVIGIDDHDLSAALGLTTVSQPAAQQGRLGAVALLTRLLGAATAPTDQLLPTELVVRESTAPPRTWSLPVGRSSATASVPAPRRRA